CHVHADRRREGVHADGRGAAERELGGGRARASGPQPPVRVARETGRQGPVHSRAGRKRRGGGQSPPHLLPPPAERKVPGALSQSPGGVPAGGRGNTAGERGLREPTGLAGGDREETAVQLPL